LESENFIYSATATKKSHCIFQHRFKLSHIIFLQGTRGVESDMTIFNHRLYFGEKIGLIEVTNLLHTSHHKPYGDKT